MYHVYILYSPGGDRYYVGQTQDLEQRMTYHNELNEHSYTSKFRPWELKSSFPVASRSVALKMEKFVKNKKQRSFLERLIATPELWEDILKKIDDSVG